MRSATATRVAARSATSTRSRAGSRPGLRARGIGPGDAVAFQLPNWVEAAATFYARAPTSAPSSCRSCTSTGPRRSATSCGSTGVKALVTADRFGHLDFLANLDDAARRTCPTSSWSPSSATTAPAPATSRSTTWPPSEPARRRRRRRPGRARRSSRTRRARRRTRRASCTRTARSLPRSASSAAMQADRGTRPRWSGRAGRPRHRHARRAADPGVTAATAIHLIDVWDPGACSPRCSRTDCRPGSGATFFLTSLLDHPDFDPRAHAAADALRRPRRLGGPGRGGRAGDRARHLDRAAASARPSTRRSPAATPRRRRATSALTPTARPLPGVEMRLVDDDGNDVERRASRARS